jgi:hypothetical protein
VERLAHKLRARRRRRLFLRSAVGVVGAAAAAGGLWVGWTLYESADYTYGGVSCTEVQKLASQFGRGELSEELSAKVRNHVRQCPRCGPRFKAMGIPV